MNCPVCDERMREISKHGVQLDICPSCKGIWLDRGELEKIVDAASGTGAAPDDVRAASAPPERVVRKDDDDDDERGGSSGDPRSPKRQRGGWLGDILGSLGGEGGD
jgi:uncharacterized protein